MAAPLGNQNARKAREWTDALRWQLDNLEVEGAIAKGQALRAIAKTVVTAAIDGNKDAWQEIGNRLDGKPVTEAEITANVETKVTGLAPIYGIQPPPEA